MVYARRIVSFGVSTALFLVVCSLLAAWLFRSAPGSDVDIRELNPGYSDASIAALRRNKAIEHDRSSASLAYLKGVLHGDLGRSELNGRPVTALLAERARPTGLLILMSASGALVCAVLIAGTAFLMRGRAAAAGAQGASTLLLSLPSGLMILLAIVFRIPAEVAAVAIIAPRLYAYLTRTIRLRASSEYVLNAHALGIPPWRVLLRQILPAMAPEMAGLAALSCLTAVAVAVPVEVLSGRPGIGELAWRAALDRDMPVVLGTTLVVALAMRLLAALSAGFAAPEGGRL